jgi:hypothetical protein
MDRLGKRRVSALMDPSTGAQSDEQKQFCDLVVAESKVKRRRAEEHDDARIADERVKADRIADIVVGRLLAAVAVAGRPGA